MTGKVSRLTGDANLGEHALERDLGAAEAGDGDRLPDPHRLAQLSRQRDDLGVPGGIGERIVMLLERRAIDADALRENLFDQRTDRCVPPA